VTQEFNISVTPIGGDEYLVRTEWTPDVTAAEERVCWPVQDWLDQASLLMHDPLLGLLRGDPNHALGGVPGDGDAGSGATSLVEFGQSLYNALFQGMLRDSWMRAQGIAQHRREVLRLRLGLKDARLPCLPWEVLHAGDRPLATGTDIAFSRYHTKCAPLVQSPAIAVDEPLRILMVLAAPSDQERLALKQEAKDLKSELESTIDRRGGQIPDIKVEILDQPDRAQLTQALEHQQYQVLHYAGHSNVGEAGGSLYLVNRTTGLTETLSGDDLAGLLVNNGIRMAVFNSCRGVYTAASYPAAQPGGSSGEGNLAEALVKRGIPAVLAMAERIPDDVALNLSRLFYRNLRRAYPVDLSLNRARQGLVSSYGSHKLYWALPTLYMHPEFDGFLQPLATAVEADWVQSAASWEAAGPMPRSRATVPLELDNPFDAVSYADGEDWLDPDLAELSRDSQAEDSVAQLVQQLSQPDWQGDVPFSPATPEENLLPDSPPLWHPGFRTGRTASSPGTLVASAGNTTSFSELQGLLADTNRLTHAIAACIQATQRDPTNAQAYRNLGQVLEEQGHLSEAIAAYTQALHLNPHDAEVHNDIGSVHLRQGQVEDAIQSYSMAIHLDPRLMAAQHNLRLAKQRQSGVSGRVNADAGPRTSELPPVSAPPSPPSGHTAGDPRPANSDVPNRRRADPAPTRKTAIALPLWLRAGAGAVGIATLIGVVWVAYTQIPRPVDIHVIQSPSTAVPPTNDWQKVSTNDAIDQATQRLSRGNVAAAQPIIEALLDRNDTAAASSVMTPVLAQHLNNPTLNFLMGRLAWQARIAGDETYKVDDARRYWEQAVKLKPMPAYVNALGFAYYEEENLDRAGKTWLRVVKDKNASAENPGNGTAASDLLTAYAGMALVLTKTASALPPNERAGKVGEALKLRQQVMTNGATHFSLEALSQNWLWSEKAIRDWRSLQAR
jgi:tetratricopeptide (TPR) repeat protein